MDPQDDDNTSSAPAQGKPDKPAAWFALIRSTAWAESAGEGAAMLVTGLRRAPAMIGIAIGRSRLQCDLPLGGVGRARTRTVIHVTEY